MRDPDAAEEDLLFPNFAGRVQISEGGTQECCWRLTAPETRPTNAARPAKTEPRAWESLSAGLAPVFRPEEPSSPVPIGRSFDPPR